MRKSFRFAAALAALALGAPGLSAQVDRVDLRDQVMSQLELSDLSLQSFDLPEGNVDFVFDVNLDGLLYEIAVTPESFRAEDAVAMVGLDGGVTQRIDLPAPLTVRGHVVGVPGARAAGSRMGGGLHMTISLPGDEGNEIWSIQPVYDAVRGADPRLHVVHHERDVDIKDPASCGIGQLEIGDALGNDGDGGQGTRAFLVCELAIDADWEYYGLNGQSESNTIADVDNILARMSAIYEGQCNVTFRVPLYLIWTTSNDPYTSSDPSTRLGQFRNWWQNNQQGVRRALAHQFTGVNLNGSVIGIAYLSAVCGSNGYGISQSRFTGGVNARTALTAHEVGHNFSAGHCDGNGDCKIMCSGLGGCNGLGNPARFGTPSANRITSYAAGRSCLFEDGIQYPFLEEWESTTIDPDVWVSNAGGVVTDAADNEPSEPYSLNLDGQDSITSGAIDISGVTEVPYLTFYAQHKGVPEGGQLVVEYFDVFGEWTELATVTSDGTDQTAFVPVIADVSVFGWWTEFAIRFRATGTSGDQDWYIDDISLAPFTGNPVPFHEPFADASFNTTTTWSNISGATVSTDATNEPSEPYSMNLDGTDSATTRNFLMATADFPTYLSFFTQHKGVEAGKSLMVEYRDFNGDWIEFTTVTSDGNDQNRFVFHQNNLIFDAYHDDFAVRFRALGDDGTDDWYVDDIRLGDEFEPPDDCIADFNGDGEVNTQDVLAFLNAWNNGDSSADINGDGVVDTQDVLAFLNLWNIGC
jgi:hypothetical protein